MAPAPPSTESVQGRGAAVDQGRAVGIAAPPPAAEAAGEGEASPDLEPRIVGEIRAALRGCTIDGLAGALGEPAARVGSALQVLLGKNVVAQRGTRWFMS